MSGYVTLDSAGGLVISAYAPSSDWSGLYDLIEFWKIGSDGILQELTAHDYRPARIPEDAGDRPSTPLTGPLVYIVGEKLDLGTAVDFEIEFTGSDPLTYAQVAEQVGQAGRGVAGYVDPDGLLVIETTVVGTSAYLELRPTDGAAKLGLPSVKTASQGHDPRLILIAGTDVYSIIDPFGSIESSYFYRYRNNANASVSELKQLVPTKTGSLGKEQVSLGFIQLNSATGMPVIGREVLLETVGATAVGTGAATSVITGERVSLMTDRAGRAQTPLVRGSIVSLMVAGTGLSYIVRVPVDKSVFNLLDPAYADSREDYFKVRAASIPFAARRSP